MRFRVVLASAFLLFLSTVAAAQTIGNYPLAVNGNTSGFTAPYTVIDLSSAATQDGAIGAVAIRNLIPTCNNGVKVKFFRRTGTTFTPYAERGPFNITGSITLVTLTPPVAVQQGDLIGLVAMTSCAVFGGQVPVLNRNAAVFNGEVSSAVSLSSSIGQLSNFALGVFGAPTGTAEIRTHVIVAAGASQGAFGSSFKTDLFLTNPRTTRSLGRLVYHPENTSGVPSDPSHPFILDFAESAFLPNFVETTLHLSGKGSIDVYTTIGFEPPHVMARIYEDSGTAGTKGFTMDALPLRDALDFESAEVGVLFTPSDPAKFRMNVGVRTLDEQTKVVYQLVNSIGNLKRAVEITYPPNFYTQQDAGVLMGTALAAGDTILVFTEITGRAFIYGSIIDNTSNDPSLQMAKPLE